MLEVVLQDMPSSRCKEPENYSFHKDDGSMWFQGSSRCVVTVCYPFEVCSRPSFGVIPRCRRSGPLRTSAEQETPEFT